MTEPFVQIEDLAKHFAVSISTIRAWVRQGHIPKATYIKIGNTYRFNKTAVSDALTKAMLDVDEASADEVKDDRQLEMNFDADQDV
jgi:excisionase family DNA binding protein|tara:strand:+ start:5416 stop:5673 length:258 start_codon:yes stop_codon:yes gene_type:complete